MTLMRTACRMRPGGRPGHCSFSFDRVSGMGSFRTLSSRRSVSWRRQFSQTSSRREIRDILQLQDRINPTYHESRKHDFLTLRWPSPPRNILLTKKSHTPSVTAALLDFARHIKASYPHVSIVLEPDAAAEVHSELAFPVYTTTGLTTTVLRPSADEEQQSESKEATFQDKVDLISTFGGDGTILRASSFFATSPRVPPILSFSMGTLGFLGEWKFREHKRAFREVYMSGAGVGFASNSLDEDLSRQSQHVAPPQRPLGSTHADEDGSANRMLEPRAEMAGWSSVRGMSMGPERGARILLRNRLNVGIYGPNGKAVTLHQDSSVNKSSCLHPSYSSNGSFAMNEVIIHRGADPHLCVISILIGKRLLTEAVADGMIVSSPTGSTAYSLSSGGAIVHPLVSSVLLTPVCPRSLSFRPLVLPAHLPVSLRVSGKNRSMGLDVSIDGVRLPKGLETGMEVRVVGERIRHRRREGPQWDGGVPSVVKGAVDGGRDGEDHWLGGLNGLLKFNYPFGEELEDDG